MQFPDGLSGYNKTKNERDSEKSKRRESIIIFQV